MELKNIRLMIIAGIGFTILTTGCSISITRNYYSTTPKTPIKKDSTAYALKLGYQLHKLNDGQR